MKIDAWINKMFYTSFKKPAKSNTKLAIIYFFFEWCLSLFPSLPQLQVRINYNGWEELVWSSD